MEVLILDDEIDEIIITAVPKYDEKELKSVNRSGAADDFSDDTDKETGITKAIEGEWVEISSINDIKGYVFNGFLKRIIKTF